LAVQSTKKQDYGQGLHAAIKSALISVASRPARATAATAAEDTAGGSAPTGHHR